MTTIRAEVVADSISPNDIRLTTLKLRYPKCIHGEFMTHRVFSRNASSSRAIPVERLIQDVIDDPFVPLSWGKNQRGMQAGEEHKKFIVIDGNYADRRTTWLHAMHNAIKVAQAFSGAGYHKQIVNRLLEPFCHIEVVVTATEWSNFFALRCHPDAEPHMRMLAEAMRDARAESTPRLLRLGEWHIPFVTDEELQRWNKTAGVGPGVWEYAVRVSTGRCARVSYLNHDGSAPEAGKDRELHDRLVGVTPLHASPAEHQATPDEIELYDGRYLWKKEDFHGNLRGWVQYRKTLPDECQ